MLYQEGIGVMEERRDRKPLFIGLALVIVIIAAVILLLLRLNSPASSSVHEEAVKTAATDTAQADFTPKRQVGQHASFVYPAQLKAAAASAVISPIQEHWIYLSRSPHSWQLAVTVGLLPAGDLMQNSNYRAFRQDPGRYQQQITSYQGLKAYIISDQAAGTYTKIAFLPHGGELATVALTGSDAGGDQVLDKALTMVWQSWQW